MICDVHAHCLPEAVDKFLVDQYDVQVLMRPVFVPFESPVSDSDEDVEKRIQMMDDAGVQTQVLSLVNLPVLKNEADTVAAVQMANDAHVRIAHRYPDRFKVYGELPLPYLDASLKELSRCRDELGITAVNILASHGTVSAVAEEFDSLFEELDRTGTIVFFHPRVSGLCSALLTDYRLNAPLGPALEDSVLVFQMLTRQFPIRFPHLQIIIPHLGGLLPIYMERMDNQMGRMLPDIPERPSVMVRRLWFDTLSHCSAVALRSARESIGVDRLVTGSDFPAMEHFQGYKASLDYIRHAGLTDEDVHQIMHVNAPTLFGIE